LIPEIHICTNALFEEVKAHIGAFELDDRQLLQEEFLTINTSSRLLAFGRIRKFTGFSELCSLGVLEADRLKGFGKKIATALIKKTTQPLFLVCVIPSFFEKLGFIICDEYPDEIREKLEYCVNALPVEQQYVVMRKN
jgi:N-acetylglutamate synthase-like GNAT family acetyltransferase